MTVAAAAALRLFPVDNRYEVVLDLEMTQEVYNLAMPLKYLISEEVGDMVETELETQSEKLR